MRGGASDDDLRGEGGIASDHARGGNDAISGDHGNDLLTGDASLLFGFARGGNDRLDGGVGNDLLLGDAIGVFDSARCGNDVVTGGGGNDEMVGDAFEFGDPTTITRGHDRFVFANGSGLDTIFDFEDGRDLIDLRGFAGIAGFADLSPANVAQVGADTVIDLGAAAGGAADADVLTLAGFTTANLDATDFLFA